MRKLLVLLFLSLSIICRADYWIGGYFIRGIAYDSHNQPIVQKEMVLVQGEFFCFFKTDKNGSFLVEVPYGVFGSCVRNSVGSSNGRIDSASFEYGERHYSGKSIEFYCGEKSTRLPPLWPKHYFDTNCMRAFFTPIRPEKMACLTDSVIIHLKDDAARDSRARQQFYRTKLDSMLAVVNRWCDIPRDSVAALKRHAEREASFIKDLNSKLSDTNRKIAIDYYGEIDRFRTEHPMSSFLDSVLRDMPPRGYELPYLLESFFSYQQVIGQNISIIEQLGLCKYYEVRKSEAENEFYILPDIQREYMSLVFRVNKKGTITAVYQMPE